MHDGHVAIIGGGIGGLTATLSLQKAGLRVSVFERAEELREVGAGLIVSGASMKGLDFLGIGDRVRAVAGKRPVRGYFDLKHYRTGVILQPGDHVPDQHLSQAVHRADLLGILLGAVRENDADAVHLGHGFESLTQDADGVSVTFTNGNTVTADALVGCDGGGSAVRPFMYGPEPLLYTGKVSFRGLIPSELVTSEIDEDCGSFYVGPDRMFIDYYVRGTEFMNVVAHARQPGWEEEGWSIPASIDEFLELYHDFPSTVHNVIKAIPAENLFKWALRDRDPQQQWTTGRVSLLGDAAHPMLPFLGQGGNQAMEDGTVLGRSFAAAGTPEEALERYEAARKRRANGVQLMSRERAEALMQFIDAEELPITAAAAQQDYDPATVPV